MMYPALKEKPDQKTYFVDQEDPAIRNDMEGGYVTSRPRFLRTPRKTFQFGYTALPDADYQLLKKHWDDVRGGSGIFTYVDFQDGKSYDVRYKSKWTSTFVGAGLTRLWDVKGIELEEV